MTTLIEPNPVRRTAATTTRTVSVAGVPWPVHKLRAVLAALAVGVVVLVVTRSPELTAWLSGGTLLAVWWVGAHLPGKAATDPRSNPLGIS
ncbi:hypothetical protein GCM10009624_33650 [Gordonia sinesedis]